MKKDNPINVYVALALLGALALASATCAPLYGAELTLVGEAKQHQFVRVKSDQPGEWVVLAGESHVETIVQGDVCVFIGPPGDYAVVLWSTNGPPAFLAVQIGGEGPPPPRPPPIEPPKPDDPVEPEAKGLISMIVLRVAEDLTADQAATLLDLRTWVDSQDTSKFAQYVIDPNQVDTYNDKVTGAYPFVFVVQAAGKGNAVIRWLGELPEDADTLIQEMRKWRK